MFRLLVECCSLPSAHCHSPSPSPLSLAPIAGRINLFRSAGISFPSDSQSFTSSSSLVSSCVSLCLISFSSNVSLSDYLSSSLSALDSVLPVENPLTRQLSIILTFHRASQCAEFFDRLNGVKFLPNSNEICLLVHLAAIEYSIVAAAAIERPNDQALMTPDHHTQLPSCPKCLSRLDTSISWILPCLKSKRTQRSKTSSRSQNAHNTRRNDPTGGADNESKGDLIEQKSSNLAVLPGDNRVSVYWAHLRCPVCDLLKRSAITIAQLAASEAENPPPAVSLPSSSSSLDVKYDVDSSFVCSSAAISSASSTVDSSIVRCSHSGCSVLGTLREAIWVCLICSSVGCGRYHQRHAHSHYLQTKHNYSIELHNHYIWDYENDGYAHRVHGHMFQPELNESEPAESQRRNQSPFHGSFHSIGNPAYARDFLLDSRVGPAALLHSRSNSFSCSASRSRSNSLSSASEAASDSEEDEIVHAKLASIHQFYNQLLTQQLQQQVQFYQLKMESERKREEELETNLDRNLDQLKSESAEWKAKAESLAAQSKSEERLVSGLSVAAQQKKDEIAFLRQLVENSIALAKAKSDSGNTTASATATAIAAAAEDGEGQSQSHAASVARLHRRLELLEREIATKMAEIQRFEEKSKSNKLKN